MGPIPDGALLLSRIDYTITAFNPATPHET
jgi:hypothetical protein